MSVMSSRPPDQISGLGYCKISKDARQAGGKNGWNDELGKLQIKPPSLSIETSLTNVHSTKATQDHETYLIPNYHDSFDQSEKGLITEAMDTNNHKRKTNKQKDFGFSLSTKQNSSETTGTTAVKAGISLLLFHIKTSQKTPFTLTKQNQAA